MYFPQNLNAVLSLVVAAETNHFIINNYFVPSYIIVYSVSLLIFVMNLYRLLI